MDTQQQDQLIQQQFTQEPPHDVIDLPSKGVFYPDNISTAKIYHLTAADESLLTAPNLVKSGNLIDELLKRKVKLEGNMQVEDLLTGDRLAILLLLRATFEPVYRIQLTDPANNSVFIHDFELTSLKEKPLTIKPDEKGEFSHFLERSKKNIKFRLLTGKDEKEIRIRDRQQMEMYKTDVSNSGLITLERQIMELEGDRDKGKIANFIRTMPLSDARALRKYVNDITPTIDTKIKVPAPSGNMIDTFLPITAEFFFPTL